MKNAFVLGAALAAAIPLCGWAADKTEGPSAGSAASAASAPAPNAGTGASTAAGMVVGPGGVRVKQRSNASTGARSAAPDNGSAATPAREPAK